MKIKSIFLLSLLSLTSLVFLHSCFQAKPKIKAVNPAFKQYIEAFSSGMISRKSSIRIDLTFAYGEKKENIKWNAISVDSTANGTSSEIALPDSLVLEDIFEFEPAVKGKAHWLSNRSIEFVPDEPMASNQLYDVTFKLEKILKVKNEFEEFDFQFATFPQALFMESEGLRTYDDYEVEYQQLSGKLKTSDYESLQNMKGVLTVEQDGQILPVKFEPTYDNQFYFSVDSIKRKVEKSKVILSWSGESIGCSSHGTMEYNVPALGDFTVSSSRVTDEDEQVVELNFSDAIAYGQNLKGIITLAGVDNLTYEIDGNLVKVFLPARIEGEKKLVVNTGIQNAKGHKMNEVYSENLVFKESDPKLRLIGKGSILPNSQGLIFPFEAISLKAVDLRIIKIYEHNVHQFLQINNLDGEDGLTRVGKIVAEKKIVLDYDKTKNLKQWNKHVIDLNKLISPEPGAIYRVCLKFSPEYSLYTCDASPVASSESSSDEYYEYEYENYNAPGADWDSTWNEYNWNNYGFSGYQTWSYYYDDYSPCSSEFFHGKAVCRNILASDLGIIYKVDENHLSHAFITNMITAKPQAGAAVEYFDYTKKLIASGVTNAEGMLDIKLSEKPFLMVVKFGKQRGYMKLQDGHALSLSKFDVEGAVVQKGVKGFLYGERGVWRPGDSLYLTFILEDKQKVLPAKHPVKFELRDPNNQVIYQATTSKNVNGMFDFRAKTTVDAPTGNYTAVVHVGNRVFSELVKIETVKPNRLKIYLDPEKGKVNDSTSKLSVKWLHGAMAKDLRATVHVSVNETKTTFEKFPNYVFDSPIRKYYSEAEAIFDANLDDKGEALVKTKLNISSTAPGKLRATYFTKVFEEGGDFSVDRNSTIYSPFNTYVGLHLPQQNNYDNSLETGNNYRFEVVTLNESGALVNTEQLQVKVYKIQWRWWYEHNESDLSTYVARHGSIALKDTVISAKNGRGAFNFKVNYPDYGRYLITVTDSKGKHQTGATVYIDWPYWKRGNRSGNDNATMLNFSCDKEVYTKGEKVKVSFPSAANGTALISVETRTKVVKKFWVNTTQGETTCEFETTAEMSPTAYVHVSLIQPHANTVNDLPIRMYGVVPVRVDDPLTHLNPQIICAESFKPESVANIKVKEQDGRKMTYTLAIVDEGLLDLTRFKTPLPWNTFYAKEALGVKTWDMYDNVIGAYAGKLEHLLSVGGDGDALNGKDVKANRFKPMVKFVGPFTLENLQEKIHKIAIPNYVGSVRVMLIAHNNGAYGSAEKTVAVKKPLMILATLPRVLGPTEQVSLPVDVFAMEANIKDVKVEVEVNDLLSLDGSKTQNIHFNQIGDEVLNFKLNVAAKIGVAKVKIVATCGNEKTTQELELDIRTPNPKVVDGSEMVLEPGKSYTASVDFKGLEGTNKATVEMSTVPSMDLEKRLGYLVQYPHGCIEQTTSSAFPQLYLNSLMELGDKRKQEISNNIKAAIKRLQLFQTGNGGFSYWPGEGYDSEWGTNYAGHFIIEAEKQGYALPQNMKNNWLKYQREKAKNWQNSRHNSDQLTQAYRLFVLALSGNAEAGAMNRLREETNIPVSCKWRLAAAYTLTAQKEVALALVKDLPVVVANYRELSGSYGSPQRDQAMILEALSLMGEKIKAAPVAKTVAHMMSSDSWLSTQETAYGLLAMCAYTGASGDKPALNVAYQLNEGEVKNALSQKVLSQVKYSDKDIKTKGKITITNNGKTTLFVKVLVEGIPLIGDKSSASKDLKMSVRYTDMNGAEINPSRIVQGTDFKVEVTMSNPGTKGYLQEMTLNQIFPSGWEIHNTRLYGEVEASNARYQDIRDDRVYSYYDLYAKASKTFVIQLNATYLGKFYLPTVYSEAMYDNMINARVPGQWVEVVKE